MQELHGHQHAVEASAGEAPCVMQGLMQNLGATLARCGA